MCFLLYTQCACACAYHIAVHQKNCIDFEINLNVYLIYTFERANGKKVTAREEVFLQKCVSLADALQI